MTKKEVHDLLDTINHRQHREERVAFVGGGTYQGYYVTETEDVDKFYVHSIGQRGAVVEEITIVDGQIKWPDEWLVATPLRY